MDKQGRRRVPTIVYVIVLVVFITTVMMLNKNSQDEKEVKVEPIKNKEVIVKEEVKLKKPQNMSVAQKKEEFYKMILPPLDKVYNQELTLFHKIQKIVKQNPNDPILEKLKEEYNAKSNLELLMALKPHPKSITIAQAAIESAWGTSRFFKEANNLFGVWSFNKDEPRIAAGSQRGDKTIWLKKYATVEDAIKDYYKQISRSWAFEDFRKLNYEKENQNPYLLVKKLDRYSEKKALYGKELSSLISFNNLTKYDAVQYKKPVLEEEKINKEPKEDTKKEETSEKN